MHDFTGTDDLNDLVEARRELAAERDRILKGESGAPVASLDRQIAALDSQMAEMILRHTQQQAMPDAFERQNQ